MHWFRRGQRPEGAPAPTAADDRAAKSSAVSITAGARIRGQVLTGALCFDKEVLSLRFLLEGVAATIYQLQLLMLCIGLWMLVVETRFRGDGAVGTWRTLVTESLDAAEAINPDLPLPDTYPDSNINQNLVDLARSLLHYLQNRGVNVEIVCQAAGGGDARVDSMCSTIDANNSSTYEHKVDCSKLNQQCDDLTALITMDPPLLNFLEVPAFQEQCLQQGCSYAMAAARHA